MNELKHLLVKAPTLYIKYEFHIALPIIHNHNPKQLYMFCITNRPEMKVALFIVNYAPRFF